MTELLDTDFLPSDPAERKRIRNAVIEASGLMQRKKDMSDQITDVISMMKDTWNIPKKVGRKMITTQFKQNYTETTQEAAVFEVCFENVMGIQDN